ncbi:MAG: hypothetical protein Q7R39_02705 [Dehalococcoidia bacterium]|nr:hypothetical protein [Dehalococcoidia bacterium]
MLSIRLAPSRETGATGGRGSAIAPTAWGWTCDTNGSGAGRGEAVPRPPRVMKTTSWT